MANDRIHEILEDFATQIRSEIQRQAMAALTGAGGATRTNGFAARSRAHAVSPRAKPRRARSSGAKRDPRALDALQARVLGFIAKHPNLRVEQINAQLGTATKDVALPIRKLLATKAIKATGQKRSTTYAAAGGAKAAAKPAKAARVKKGRKGKGKRGAKAAKPAAAASA